MKNQYIKHAVLLAIALAAAPAFARDITHEQQEAYDANTQLREANSAYEDAVKDVENQNKQIENQKNVLAREQAKLKELQDKQAAAQKALENAQADKDAKDKILNQAWEQRDK